MLYEPADISADIEALNRQHYLLHCDSLAHEISGIKRSNGGIRLFARLHGHEPKSTRLTRMRIIHDLSLLDLYIGSAKAHCTKTTKYLPDQPSQRQPQGHGCQPWCSNQRRASCFPDSARHHHVHCKRVNQVCHLSEPRNTYPRGPGLLLRLDLLGGGGSMPPREGERPPPPLDQCWSSAPPVPVPLLMGTSWVGMLIPPPLLAGAMSCDCQAERGGGWKSQVGPRTRDRRAGDTTRTGRKGRHRGAHVGAAECCTEGR